MMNTTQILILSLQMLFIYPHLSHSYDICNMYNIVILVIKSVFTGIRMYSVIPVK